MKWIFTLSVCIGFFLLSGQYAAGQTVIPISGTVFDTSKVYSIPDVKVFSTSGNEAVTDSLGAYRINTYPGDSIFFFYNGKNSVKYPIADIYDFSSFDIAMHVKPASKYKVLPGVTVFSDTYREDSLENRERYAKIFDRGRPAITIGTGVNGVPGMDIGSIAELFQFKKNKRINSFQQRLLMQEQEGYVNYRFNARLITRITGLTGRDLEDYMDMYRPPYEFVSESTLVEFYQYIIDSSDQFKKRRGIE